MFTAAFFIASGAGWRADCSCSGVVTYLKFLVALPGSIDWPFGREGLAIVGTS